MAETDDRTTNSILVIPLVRDDGAGLTINGVSFDAEKGYWKVPFVGRTGDELTLSAQANGGYKWVPTIGTVAALFDEEPQRIMRFEPDKTKFNPYAGETGQPFRCHIGCC